MTSPGSVSAWINLLKGGDAAGIQQLWEAYFPRLVGMARKKLQESPRRAADEEDVALSAFDSFCVGAARGRFPQLTDRDDLWHILVTITARKALQLLRHEQRQKRGGTDRLASACHDGPETDRDELGAEQIIGNEPTPEYAAQLAEEYEQLLARLGDPDLRRIAVWKMEGYN